jgi:hypothetical protein
MEGLVSPMMIIALVMPYCVFPEDIGWFPRHVQSYTKCQ